MTKYIRIGLAVPAYAIAFVLLSVGAVSLRLAQAISGLALLADRR